MLELAKKRGITELHKYLTDRGVSKHHATELRQNRLERFDLQLLMRLCIIFKCPIHELIVFEAEAEKEMQDWPGFSSMRASETQFDMNSKLSRLDSEKLKLLEQFLEPF